jgi:hypothetical protein
MTFSPKMKTVTPPTQMTMTCFLSYSGQQLEMKTSEVKVRVEQAEADPLRVFDFHPRLWHPCCLIQSQKLKNQVSRHQRDKATKG